jgi:hypothetical protein
MLGLAFSLVTALSVGLLLVRRQHRPVDPHMPGAPFAPPPPHVTPLPETPPPFDQDAEG